MAYVKQTVNQGDVMEVSWGNQVQTQYDEAKKDLDAEINNLISSDNLVPLFDTESWNFHANVTIDSPSKITLNASSIDENSSINIKAKSSTQYTFDVKTNSPDAYMQIIEQDSSGTTITSQYPDGSNPLTFTTSSTTENLFIRTRNSTTGTHTFEDIMLNEGSTTLASYLPRYREDISPKSLIENGRIIEETGSNSNGEYIRFADGTQICWSEVTVDYTLSGWQSFTLPASFISTPYSSAWSSMGGAPGGNDIIALQNAFVDSYTTTTWRWRCDGTGTTTSDNLSLYAIGRWK